jgi:nucleoside-diphosphate-sugar epimerase
MTVLVTGATGLVGSHLLDELLARGTEVRVLVRDPHKAEEIRQRGVDVRLGDIREPGLMSLVVRDIDVVYHCAAALGPDHSRQTIYETNLTGVLNLLHALHQVDRGRAVLLSSIDVLGMRDLEAADEDLPWRLCGDPAADVQIEMEKLVLDYRRRHGVDAIILRPGFIYGPRDVHILPRLMRSLRDGTFSFIGSPDNVVPIVHVGDVVQAMLLAGAHPHCSGRTFHIADGSRTTVGQFVQRLSELLGCRVAEKVRPFWLARATCGVWEVFGRWLGRPAAIDRDALRFLGLSRHVDIRRARDELGFRPRFGYEAGLADATRGFNPRAPGPGQAVSLSP